MIRSYADGPMLILPCARLQSVWPQNRASRPSLALSFLVGSSACAPSIYPGYAFPVAISTTSRGFMPSGLSGSVVLRRCATIGSLPGSPTERNVRRMGFHVAYVKPHLIRPGPGLKPINT